MSKLLDTFDAWYLAEYGVPVSLYPRETLAAAQMRAAFNAGRRSALAKTPDTPFKPLDHEQTK